LVVGPDFLKDLSLSGEIGENRNFANDGVR